MELIIGKKIIDQDIETILKVIKDTSNNITTQCPFHKDGRERNPSFSIYSDKKNPNVEYGWCKCFTCGYNAPLYAMVGRCFGKDDEFGKEWLAERFGNTYAVTPQLFPDIRLDLPKPERRVIANISIIPICGNDI